MKKEIVKKPKKLSKKLLAHIIMLINYVDVPGKADEAVNMGGTKQWIAYAPVRDFLVMQTTTPSTTPDSTVDITTTHTFITGRCMKKLYCTIDKGQAGNVGQGEIDGKSWAQSAKIFIPGADSLSLGTANIMQNDRLIFFIPMPDGTVLQIGSADFYASIDAKFGTGTNKTGIRGTEFDISSMQPAPLVYKGTLNFTPAS